MCVSWASAEMTWSSVVRSVPGSWVSIVGVAVSGDAVRALSRSKVVEVTPDRIVYVVPAASGAAGTIMPLPGSMFTGAPVTRWAR